MGLFTGFHLYQLHKIQALPDVVKRHFPELLLPEREFMREFLDEPDRFPIIAVSDVN
jgi:hypothetical protein